MPEAKRDEVPLPEPIDAQWRRHWYTEDQLREYGRQCAKAAVPVMPQEVMDGVRLLEALAKFPSRKDEGTPLRALLAWLRSQNLIKE